jgi:hypothetical protein
VSRTERGKITELLYVSDQLILHGMATAGVRVGPGGSLDLHGTVVGALVVEEGGSARIFGTVTGDVHNEGGTIAVFGVVDGRLIRSAGETTVDPRAVIRSEG